MAVAESASAPSSLPMPDECDHPLPIRGVMAHEFSHYSGAQGPEGTRRTVTFYGPVIGGLPIAALHCEQCGLLKLSFPDGRREDRRMYPGPQPGLLAEATTIDVDLVDFGMQARVSGLSISPQLAEELAGEVPPLPALIPTVSIELPKLGWATWTSVTLLSLTGLGLLIAAVLAVYDYTTSPAEGTIVVLTSAAFAGFLVVSVGVFGARHLFPLHELPPSAAQRLREKPDLDSGTKTVVAFLVLGLVGLLVAAVLAVYSYNISSLEGLVFGASLVCFGIALLTAIGMGISRHFGDH